MAEDVNFFAAPLTGGASPRDTQEVGWADWGRSIESGAEGLMSSLNSGGRYLAGQTGNELAQEQFAAHSTQWGLDQQDTLDAMTPEARERLEASVTSPEFWAHPFSAGALKGLSMTPAIAATVLPAGIFSSGVAATMAVGGLGGAMSASDYLDDVYKSIDAKSDDDLMKASDYYAAKRTMGMSEEDARADYTQTLMGMKPLVAFAIGAVANAVGPTGTMGRGLAGAASKRGVLDVSERLALKAEQHPGIITRLGEGAAVGAASEIVDEGTTNVLSQTSKVEGGLQDAFDVDQLKSQALEGGLMGGVMGGAAHALTGGGRAKSGPAPEKKPATTPVQTVDSRGPDIDQKVAMQAANPPSVPQAAPQPPASMAAAGAETPVHPAAPTPPTPADQARAVTQEMDNAAAPAQAPAPQVQQPSPVASPDANTVPESPATIEEQVKQLSAGQRKVVMVPEGTKPPAAGPKGALALRIPGLGLFYYNHKLITRDEIMQAAKSNRLNEVLSLGQFNKQDVAQRIQQGETPVAVTERTPDGVEVKSAAGTNGTAPSQVADLEATKTPGNTVQVESPKTVIEQRRAAAADEARALTEELVPRAPRGQGIANAVADINKAIAPPKAEAAKAVERSKPKRMEPVAELKTGMPTPEEDAAYHDRNFAAVKEKEPTLTREQYEGRRKAGMDMLKGMLGREDKAEPAAPEEPAQTAKPFELSDEFQEVPHGTQLPKGTLRRMQNGKLFARKLNDAEKQVTDAGNKKTGLSLEEAEKVAGVKAEPPGAKGAEVKEKAASKRRKAPEKPAEAPEKVRRRAEASAQIDRLGLDRKVWTPEHVMALEDIKGGKLDDTQFAERDEETGEPVPKGKKHRSNAEIQKDLDDANNARTLFEDHVADAEIPPVPTTPEARHTLAMRLETYLKMAENLGIKVPTRVHAGTPDHIVYLREAQDMLDTLRNNDGKGRLQQVQEHIAKFYPDEYAARTKGDFGPFRERRKLEGEMARKRYAEDKPALEQEGEALNTIENQADTRPTPEQEISDRQEGVTHEGNSGALTDEDIANLPEEARTALLQKRADEETARLDAAKKVVGENGELAAPKSAAGKGKIVVETKGKRGSRRLVRLGEHKGQIEGAHGDLDRSQIVRESTLDDALDRMYMDEGKFGPSTGLARSIVGQIARRLRQKVGAAQVYVVKSADYKRITGEATGAFWHSNGYIVVSDAQVRGGAIDAHVLTHEALHEAFARVMDADEATYDFVERLRQYTQDQARSNTDTMGSAHAEYGFTDAHEFLAEALSNPNFQAVLSAIKAPDWAVKETGIKGKASLWEALKSLVADRLSLFKSKFGMSNKESSVLEAMLRVGGKLDEMSDKVGLNDALAERAAVRPVRLTDTGKLREEARDRGINLKGRVRRGLDYLSMGHQLAQRAAAYFSGSDAPRRVMEFREMMRVAKSKILDGGGHDFIREGADLERKYKGSGKFEQAANVAYEATINDVNLGPTANNDHLGADKAKGWQAKKRLPEMQEKFNALPGDLQAWITKGAQYFRDVQNDISLEQIKNILDVAGVDEPGLAERIFKDGMTDADRAKFKTDTVVANLNKARDLKKINGMYFPLLREGQYIVTGRHGLETPLNGERVAPDTIQFVAPDGAAASRRMAQEYAEGANLTHVGTKKVYVDANDHTKLLEKEDVNSVPAYRVTMQTQHMELHDNEADALRAAQELRDAGVEVDHVGLKAQNPHARNGDMLSSQLHQLVSSLKRRRGFTSLDDRQRNELIQALNESSVRFLAGTRVQQRMLPRRKVTGYSTDLLRNSARYADMAAGYLAKLRYMPKVEEALGEMQKYIKDHGDEKDDRTLRRDELFRQFENRVYRPDEVVPEAQTATQKFTRRLLQISQLDKLAGVSFHLINSAEPWTTSLPVIGARHGFFQAQRGLMNAYRFIGAGDGVIAAIKDTVKAARQDTGFTDYLQMFKDGINQDKSLVADTKARYVQLLDHLHLRGLLDNQSGLEVSRTADPSAGRLGRGLDKADLMARQMGQSIESINRAVTGLAAYHLEFRRTGDHQASLQYAHDVTADTMGNYSTTNSAPVFNTTLGRLTLQFKKFGQKTYYLLGKSIKGTLAGDPEAAKQFAGLMFTHAIVAGALGLPIEPFKVALMVSNALGATPYSYDDFEAAVRRGLANVTGSTKAAEIIAHGLPRAAGIDLSGRVGLDNLLVFGSPQGTKRNDITAFLAQTVAGAPLGYMLDQIDASQALLRGDYHKAIELTVPLKIVTDAMRAGEGVTSGKIDKNGREVMAPYSPLETVAQGIGLTPSRKLESAQLRGTVQRETYRQTGDRHDFMNKWASGTADDRAKLWGKIEAWNRDRPREAQLTRAQLDKYLKTRREEKPKGQVRDGVRVTKQNQYIYQKSKVYNVE